LEFWENREPLAAGMVVFLIVFSKLNRR
jgi:hypothetical protein